MCIAAIMVFGLSVQSLWSSSSQFRMTTDLVGKSSPKAVMMMHQNDICIMSRTYSGDRWNAARTLLPSVQMFLNRLKFDFYMVLDDESQEDHQWAECLVESFDNVQIKYQAQPEYWEKLFHGAAFGRVNPKKYARAGYDRQQWSTFFLDEVAEPHHEIIGAIDADGCFYSYLTRENILAPDGRIKLRAAHANSHYQMDQAALGMPTPYDFMYIDRMPITFWKSTFANVRHHIAKHWNKTFDDAFQEFSVSRYSQFNIIATYAINMEPEKYVLILHDSPSEEGTVSVGSNYCKRGIVNTGCCATYSAENCTVDPDIVANAINSYANYASTWAENQTLSNEHYSNVDRELTFLQRQHPTEYDRMSNLCAIQQRGETNVTKCIDFQKQANSSIIGSPEGSEKI